MEWNHGADWIAVRQECESWDICRSEELVHRGSFCTNKSQRPSWKTTEKAGDKAYLIVLKGSVCAALCYSFSRALGEVLNPPGSTQK